MECMSTTERSLFLIFYWWLELDENTIYNFDNVELQVTSAARETTFGSEGYHHQHQSNNPNHFKATPVSFVYKSKEHVRRSSSQYIDKVVYTSYFLSTLGLSSSKIRRYAEA